MKTRFWLNLTICLCSASLYAQNVNEQTRQRQELERQIEVIDKQIASNQKLQQATLRELDLLQQKVASRKKLLTTIEAQMKQINDSIKMKEGEIKTLQDEYEKVEFAYIKMLYQAYAQRSRQVWITHILASDNLRQAYLRWQYFKNYARFLNQQSSQIKEANNVLVEEISSLQKLNDEAVALKEVQQKELTTFNQDERKSKQMVAEMSRQEGRLRTQLQQKQRDINKINQEIARIMAEAEKNRKTASPKELETDRALAATFEQNKGQLPWPINNGVITEPYGQRNHPVLKGIKLPFNNGIGISAHQGDEVHSVFQGVVTQVVLIPGYNQCVMVQHGSFYTFYCKLGSVKVKPGDGVATGDVLGALAEIDGESVLHFELWKGADKQNPELWLRKTVRP